MEGKLVGL